MPAPSPPATRHVFRPDPQMLTRQIALVLLLCVGVVLPVLWGFGIEEADALLATATIFAVALGISVALYLGLVPVRVEITAEAVTVCRRLRPPRVLTFREIQHVSYDGKQDAIRLFASTKKGWFDSLMADLVIRTGPFSTADTNAMLSLLDPAANDQTGR